MSPDDFGEFLTNESTRCDGMIDLDNPQQFGHYPKVGDKWNVYKITADGDHLLVELNGDVTADVRDSQMSEGPIGLQWGRGTLRFRKVEIMEL